MYADLEKIEARGKRKKEKSKGLFSSFGKKDNNDPQAAEETPEMSPVPPETKQPVPQVEDVPPQISPSPPPPPEPVKKATPPTPAQPAPSTPIPKPRWTPLSGGKLEKANEELLTYKKWLNKGYKSGVLTKEQCIAMVKAKEIEMGLRPPE